MVESVVSLANARGGTPAAAAQTAPPPLERGQLHEIHARQADGAGALAFALCANRGGTGGGEETGMAMLVRMARRARSQTVVNGEGLALLGFDPARLTIVEAATELDLLRAGLEAARAPGVDLVLLELHGRFGGYDLTASRRLALAAERSRVRVIVLHFDAEPRPSAARTRWSVASAPSTALEAEAPGDPVIAAELLRWRGGPAGRTWRLEWDTNDATFREAGHRAALSGAVVSLPVVRAGPSDDGGDDGGEPGDILIRAA